MLENLKFWKYSAIILWYKNQNSVTKKSLSQTDIKDFLQDRHTYRVMVA